jgi:hypothetical protein
VARPPLSEGSCIAHKYRADHRVERWSHTLKVFNENHKYPGYDIIVFRKKLLVEELELFIEK